MIVDMATPPVFIRRFHRRRTLCRNKAQKTQIKFRRAEVAMPAICHSPSSILANLHPSSGLRTPIPGFCMT
jgi:hypothetical protein